MGCCEVRWWGGLWRLGLFRIVSSFCGGGGEVTLVGLLVSLASWVGVVGFVAVV